MPLKEEIEDYVKTVIEGFESLPQKTKKVIHDPIHGSNIFNPHEIALIDTPFLQRLRDIKQTDVAYLVYPSANVSRFEHSLGVAIMAGKIMEALAERNADLISKEDFQCVRLAGLLHDISHGPFSHLTEDLFKDFPETILLQKQNEGLFKPDRPTEMIAYYMITSPAFQEFYRNEIIKKYSIIHPVECTEIAEMIIGKMSDPELKDYRAQIINGPFDADKLDYLKRDSYFAGFNADVDLERLLYSIWLDTKPSEPRRIKVTRSGIVVLEQMLFHKIQFYSRIYHHHKVRAAECLIKGIFEIIQDNTNFTICGRRMDRAIDFLHVTETDILSLNDKPPELQKYIKRLYNRKLFKRALVISADTVEKPDIHTGYSKLQSLAEDNKSIKSLRQLIVEELDHKYPIYDIWVDLPKTPPTIEGEQTIIQDEGRNTKPRRLSEFFRVGEWLNAYRSVKWQGYVFCPDHPEIRRKVGKKAAKVIEDIYKISFNDNAFEYAKLD